MDRIVVPEHLGGLVAFLAPGTRPAGAPEPLSALEKTAQRVKHEKQALRYASLRGFLKRQRSMVPDPRCTRCNKILSRGRGPLCFACQSAPEAE